MLTTLSSFAIIGFSSIHARRTCFVSPWVSSSRAKVRLPMPHTHGLSRKHDLLNDLHRDSDEPVDGIPIKYFTTKDNPVEALKVSYGRTPDMMRWLQARVKQPFPCRKYADSTSGTPRVEPSLIHHRG